VDIIDTNATEAGAPKSKDLSVLWGWSKIEILRKATPEELEKWARRFDRPETIARLIFERLRPRRLEIFGYKTKVVSRQIP
jgi:hypothetical protein